MLEYLKKPLNLLKKLPSNVAGLISSVPAVILIYLVSYSAVNSDPEIVLIVILGMLIPFMAIAMVFLWRYRKIKQYKNFDPNDKFPQCAVASTSAMISGIGIGSSLSNGTDITLMFNFLSILLLGSFTILSVADNHGQFLENPCNEDSIRDKNNEVQKERMAIFGVDASLCLLLPFFSAIIVTYYI